MLEQNLVEKREIVFVKLILNIDTEVIRNFMAKTFENFCIKNGKIKSLTLKNVLKIGFYY